MRIECEPWELISLIEEATNKNMYSLLQRVDELQEVIKEYVTQNKHISGKEKEDANCN